MSRFLLALVVLLSLISLSNAGLIYQRTVVPQGWSMFGSADLSTELGFTIGLHTQNQAELEELFVKATDPASDDYLNYLSTSEINARFGANEEDVQTVISWLVANGVNVDQIKPVHGAIRVVTTAAVAQDLFSTQMKAFRHTKTGRTVVRAWGKYSLPDEIHQLVEIVTGISSFPIPGKSPFKTPKADPTSDVIRSPDATELVVPQTVMGMYRIRAQTPGSATVSQGVIEYEQQYFSNTDTATFAKDVGYTTSNTTIAPISDDHIVGKNSQTSPQIEASLDVQFISSVNLEAVQWFWIEDGTGWLYEFGTHILNVTAPPQVTSTSYGWWEGDQCAIDGTECQVLGVDSYGYAAAVNKLFQKIGMAGVSLLVASGDSGANGRTDEFCSAKQLRPEFPAASPFVTTVGATQIMNATYSRFNGAPICATSAYSCIENGIEVAVSLPKAGFTSGGGFSNVSGATRPSWQADAVSAYLASGVKLPPAAYYKGNGRGEPDVAAVGHNGLTVTGGGGEPVGGTSMSSPIFAAVASLLNAIAFTKTGNSLGFLNPLLYTMQAACPDCFTDITVGDNICPEDGCESTCQGFYAAKGWDPVTGLGTPIVNKMEAYVTGLMDKVLARRAAKAATVQHRHAKSQ
jgi:tripeptidyl-peptidase-1